MSLGVEAWGAVEALGLAVEALARPPKSYQICEKLIREIDKSKIELLFSNGKVADAEIEKRANELQVIIQKMAEKEERWFELSAKMEE